MLKFNLTESGMLSVLPWLTMAFSANFGGWIADSLVSKGMPVTVVRKVNFLNDRILLAPEGKRVCNS